MKTMKMSGEVSRVAENRVAGKIKDGWNYCPKSEWKKIHNPKPSKPATIEKSEKSEKSEKNESDKEKSAKSKYSRKKRS